MIIRCDIRTKILLNYLKNKQIQLLDDRLGKLQFIYIPCEVLRRSLGRHTYKEAFEKIVSDGLIKMTSQKFTSKYGYTLYTIELFDDITIEEIVNPSYVERKIIAWLDSFNSYDLSSAGEIAIEGFKSLTYEGKPIGANAKEDDFGGRLYTSVTSMHSKDRFDKLRIDGERIAEIDMKQCQPKLLEWFLRQSIGECDFVKFMQSGSDIYEHIQNRLSLGSRGQAKKVYYKMVYGHVDSFGSKIFKKLFPEAAGYINKIKKTKYSWSTEKTHVNISKIMHQLEVDIFREVWFQLKSNGVKFVTCHDAVFIKESDVDIAMAIEKDVFSAFGVDAIMSTSNEGHSKPDECDVNLRSVYSRMIRKNML